MKPNEGDWKIIVIIPARGGSKGLPRKNILDLGGKPLIVWSIEQALAVAGIDYVFVSTEDKEIAGVALEYGAQVPFLRPTELAQDDSNVGDAVNYTLSRLRSETGIMVQGCLTLFPSHPFRSRHMLEAAVAAIKNGHRSFSTLRQVNEFFVVSNHTDEMKPLTLDLAGRYYMRGYRPYGLVTAFSTRWERDGLGYVISDLVHTIDIDTSTDMHIAQCVLEKGIYDFES